MGFEVESIRTKRKTPRSGGDRDDRGWTLLHMYARKGDLREVFSYTCREEVLKNSKPCFV